MAIKKADEKSYDYKGSAGRISDEDKTLKQRYSVSLGDASLKESFPYEDLLPDAIKLFEGE